MKPYPSSMREKRRYVVFEVVSDKGKFTREAVMKALWDTVINTIGTVGAAQAAFWLFTFDSASQKGILRCTNTSLPVIRGSLTLLQKIEGNAAFIHVKSVTGTIKKAEALMKKK